MNKLDEIRAHLAAVNPNPNRTQNGVDIPLIDAEREAWLDSASKEILEAVFEWKELRSERNSLLTNSDWTQLIDADVDKKVWATYRQALRDLPANTEDPRNPVWPTPPS